MAVSSALARFDRWFLENRPALYGQLQPGLVATAISEMTLAAGLKLPSPLRSWFAWKNGQRSQDSIIGGWMFVQLSDALSSRRGLAASARDLRASGYEDLWGEGWTPFLSNGLGDYVCFDPHGSFDGKTGQVVSFFHEELHGQILAPSFEAWLSVVVRVLEAGVLEADIGWDGLALESPLQNIINEICPHYPQEWAAAMPSDAPSPPRLVRKMREAEVVVRCPSCGCAVPGDRCPNCGMRTG